MAIFKYVGSHIPVESTGEFVLKVIGSTGMMEIPFIVDETFEVTDEKAMAAIEYHTDSWSREYDFVVVG